MVRRADRIRGHRAGLRPHTGYVAAMALFAAVFASLVLGAFHAPKVHGLPVGIVGSASAVRQVQGALDTAAPGGFDVHAYSSETAARAAVAHGTVDGALVDSPGGRPELLLAQAAGTAPTQAVSTAFGAFAARSGQSLAVTDVVPPRPGDSLGLSPFFVILTALFPSMAAGSVSALVFRRSGPVWCVAAPVVAAAGIGAVSAGIADGVAGLGHYPAVAGIVALFALAVAAPTAALGRIKPPLMALALLVLVVLSIPVSGGPSGLASFTPGFLRVLHPILPLGTAADALRRTVYFGGFGTSGPLAALACWALLGLAALALVTRWRRRQSAQTGMSPSAARDHGSSLTSVVTSSPAMIPAAAGPVSVDTESGPAFGGGSSPFPSANIVVGFDDSAPARRALERAARLAAVERRVLHVVYADHVLIGSDLSGFAHAEMEEARDRQAAAVAQAAADIAARAGVPHTFERSRSAAGDAILAAASALAAGDEHDPVIVVGRSGHAARHLLGSVPAHLLNRSPFPVLAIP